MITRRVFAGTVLWLPLGAAVNTREPAPRFRALTIEGEKVDNEALKGKVVLLQFWTTWCGYCRRDQDAVETMVERYTGKGLVVLAVNVGESRRKVRRYLAENPRSCKIVLTEDTNLVAVFQARGYPLYITIDRDGRLAGRQEGAGGDVALRQLLSKAGLRTE